MADQWLINLPACAPTGEDASTACGTTPAHHLVALKNPHVGRPSHPLWMISHRGMQLVCGVCAFLSPDQCATVAIFFCLALHRSWPPPAPCHPLCLWIHESCYAHMAGCSKYVALWVGLCCGAWMPASPECLTVATVGCGRISCMRCSAKCRLVTRWRIFWRTWRPRGCTTKWIASRMRMLVRGSVPEGAAWKASC